MAKRPKQYPHVDGVTDWRAQQSIRLLWDRVFDLHGRVETSNASLTELGSTLAAQEDQLTTIQRMAGEALAQAQRAAGEGEPTGGIAGGGKDDGGAGAAGCAAASSTGHLTGSIAKTVTNAGKIVCGVGNEFPALKAATTTYALRQANRNELLNRMVWHLNQAGFPACRYPGTGPENEFNLLFDALGLNGSAPMREFAYRVTTYDPVPNSPWDTTHTYETCMVCNGNGSDTSITTTPDAGTPD